MKQATGFYLAGGMFVLAGLIGLAARNFVMLGFLGIGAAFLGLGYRTGKSN